MLTSLTRATKLRPRVSNSRKVISPIRAVSSVRDINPVRAGTNPVRVDTSDRAVISPVKAGTSNDRAVISPVRVDTSSVIPNLKPPESKRQTAKPR